MGRGRRRVPPIVEVPIRVADSRPLGVVKDLTHLLHRETGVQTVLAVARAAVDGHLARVREDDRHRRVVHHVLADALRRRVVHIAVAVHIGPVEEVRVPPCVLGEVPARAEDPRATRRVGVVPLRIPAPIAHVVTTGALDGGILPLVRGSQVVTRQATPHDVGDTVGRHAHGADPRAARRALLAPQVG